MQNIDDNLASYRIDQLAERIEAETGLTFPPVRYRDLTLGVRRMAESLALNSDAECVDWLLAGCWDESKVDLCARHLTIGETYFFREPRAFDLVRDYARQKFASGDTNSRMRIWSAGCCTGEEAYSVAIALKHVLPALDSRQISILGTDINSRHLQSARAGVYRHWSFRNVDPVIQKLNFTEACDGQFRLNDDIRELVKFSKLNLAAPVFPAVTTGTYAMDIIFCRNVLMYFSRSQAQKVIERFRQCLVNGGWLIVSPSEASAELFSGFTGVYYPDAIFFRKNNPSNDPAPASIADRGARCEEPQTIDITAGVMYAAPAVEGINPKRADAPDTDLSASETDAVRRARRLANEGDTAEAMRCLEKVIIERPSSAELYFAKALIAMEAGDTNDALRSLKRVIYLHPDNIMAHYLMGVIHSSQDRRRDAARIFETVGGLLAALQDDDLVPGSEGLSAAYLLQSVKSYLQKESA